MQLQQLQKSKPNLKTQSKSKPIKKDAGLKKGRRKEASSNEVMVWINKGRKYGPKNEQKALECYEKAEELKPNQLVQAVMNYFSNSILMTLKAVTVKRTKAIN